MKKFIKVFSVLLAIALLAVCFAGCGAKDSGKAELVMGTNPHFPPYEFVDDDGKIIGIDAEIAQAVAEKLGMELVIKDMDFESLLSAVNTDSIDIVLAGLTVTEERKQSVNFTQSYATGKQVIIVKKGSPIATVDDLEGKKIGVQSGTTGDIYCTDDFGEENVKQYTNGSLAVAALNNDQVDCVVIDNEPAKNFVAANKGLEILETEYIVEEYAACVAKSDTELCKKVDKAITELKKDGTIDKILAKYIKAE